MLHMENMEIPADNCPVAPPSQVTVYTRVLHRACQIVGGVESLATRLRVPVATLYRWLDGEAEPPTPGVPESGGHRAAGVERRRRVARPGAARVPAQEASDLTYL
jgi:hypothetical protein